MLLEFYKGYAAMNNSNFFKEQFQIKEYDVNHKQIRLLGIKIRFKHGLNNQKFYDYLPIQNNKIVFRCSSGAYCCNPKAIAEEIRKQKLPYELVFVVNENILNYLNGYPSDIRLVMQGTKQALKEYATAKIWVENERRGYYISQGFFKRNGQVYIQTFHGSLGIKKTGNERSDINKKCFTISKIDSKEIDFLISNGSWTTNFLKKIFWNNGKILEIGHPRNDIFFKENDYIKEKVYEYYNISTDKKIVLYAPTLREDQDISCYSLEFDKLKKALSEKFGGDWVVMIRLHPLIADFKEDLLLNSSNVIDATYYSDIQDLLVASDCLITDYSSCVFDYIHQQKPAFIYATDIEKYYNNRGFQYSLSETPFLIAINNEQLINNIKIFDNENYKMEVEKFIKGKGCIDKGQASEKVVELIKNIIENNSGGINT